MEIALTSNAVDIVRHLQGVPERMNRQIAKAFDYENEMTIAYAQRTKLSGPRPEVLGVVTNRLRLSLRKSAAVIQGDAVVSAIGTNVRYAGVHEHGFDGDVDVAQHSRRILGQASRYTVSLETGRISAIKHKRKQRAVLGIVTVRAHRRHMKMPARPFISSSIAERSSDYSGVVSAAILVAWRDRLSP